MHNPVVTAQIAHLLIQVSARRPMIIQDDDLPTSTSFLQPEEESHQPTVVEERCEDNTDTLAHKFSPISPDSHYIEMQFFSMKLSTACHLLYNRICHTLRRGFRAYDKTI